MITLFIFNINVFIKNLRVYKDKHEKEFYNKNDIGLPRPHCEDYFFLTKRGHIKQWASLETNLANLLVHGYSIVFQVIVRNRPT